MDYITVTALKAPQHKQTSLSVEVFMVFCELTFSCKQVKKKSLQVKNKSG